MPKKWKVIDNFNYGSVEECIENLEKDGYRICDWVRDIAPSIKMGEYKYPLELWRLFVSDLDFNTPQELQCIYQEISLHGFKLVPPEIAIQCRFLYNEQRKGEWLRIATPLDSMIDSDGIPHLPKLGCALDNYYLHTYWSYPGAIFHPHNEFVVCR